MEQQAADREIDKVVNSYIHGSTWPWMAGW
jgi:hypothetical protein